MAAGTGFILKSNLVGPSMKSFIVFSSGSATFLAFPWLMYGYVSLLATPGGTPLLFIFATLALVLLVPTLLLGFGFRFGTSFFQYDESQIFTFILGMLSGLVSLALLLLLVFQSRSQSLLGLLFLLVPIFFGVGLVAPSTGWRKG